MSRKTKAVYTRISDRLNSHVDDFANKHDLSKAAALQVLIFVGVQTARSRPTDEVYQLIGEGVSK